MFTLGIPGSQYRRTTHVLSHQGTNPINYDELKQEDGFYLFSFPNISEDEFKTIILLLKKNGITTIGADEQLTEKKIMKLANLINLEALGDSWKTQKFGSEEGAPKYIGGDLHNASIEYKGKKYTIDFTEPEVGGEENPEDATSYKPEYDEPYNMIYRARVDGIEFEVEADMLGFQTGEPEGDITLNYDKDSLEIRWDSLDANEVTSEGSCGYSQEAPDGRELDTPGDTQGREGDDSTRAILRKLIRKEIANLKTEEPNEGNAFGAALQKVKDVGEKEFEFQGKKYTT